jgi:hypothetical protein
VFRYSVARAAADPAWDVARVRCPFMQQCAWDQTSASLPADLRGANAPDRTRETPPAVGERWLQFPVAAITAPSVPPAISALGHECERSWLELVKDLLQPRDMLVEPGRCPPAVDRLHALPRAEADETAGVVNIS